jgi:hypothetical protein
MVAALSNTGDCGGGKMDIIQTYVSTMELRPVEARQFCRDIALYGWNGCSDVRVIREVQS